MTFFKRILSCLLLFPILCLAQDAAEPPLASSTTGMETQITDLRLPGSQLEPKPLADANSPIVLRIVQVFPHVDDWRYDFSFYGIVPGTHDLRDYLQRKDRSSMEGVPPIPVEILPMRPVGELIRPEVTPEMPPRVGGYKKALIVIGVFWLAVLALLVFGFRKRTEEQLVEKAKPVTLADQLRPLVKQAQAGELSQSGQAELERKLLGIWRKRLNLQEGDPAVAIIKLREDEQAGALLRELEKWLHRPGSADEVDLGALLKPYEHMPPE